jgi:FkbM family methyltransferase
MNKSSVVSFAARHLPRAVRIKRWLVAFGDAIRKVQPSYSQFGEDREIFTALAEYDLLSGIYVDVGANQPTQISNTYLFYRHGCHGVAIDPNRDMISLFRRFRPRDIGVPIGCADRAGVLEFKHATSSGQSTLSGQVAIDCVRSEFVPVLPLDDALEKMRFAWIFYLSIDVEGLDLAVLQGAPRTLSKTLFLSVESTTNKSAILNILEQTGFRCVRETPCNFIFRNSQDFPEHKRRP